MDGSDRQTKDPVMQEIQFRRIKADVGNHEEEKMQLKRTVVTLLAGALIVSANPLLAAEQDRNHGLPALVRALSFSAAADSFDRGAACHRCPLRRVHSNEKGAHGIKGRPQNKLVVKLAHFGQINPGPTGFLAAHTRVDDDRMATEAVAFDAHFRDR